MTPKNTMSLRAGGCVVRPSNTVLRELRESHPRAMELSLTRTSAGIRLFPPDKGLPSDGGGAGKLSAEKQEELQYLNSSNRPQVSLTPGTLHSWNTSS